MFSTKEYLAKKTGPYGVGRLSYLQQLVNEFQDTQSNDAKHQVLANLANFAYDPINYDYLWQLNIVDLFLDCLTEADCQLVEYAISGICNIVLDQRNRDHLIRSKSVPLIVRCLSSSNEETVITAITCLIYLITPQTHAEIVQLPLVEALLRLSCSSNARLSNVAQVFLQVQEAEAAGRLWDQQDKQATQLIQHHASLIASGASTAASAHTARLS